LDAAYTANEVKAYHFALLRQALENISSFLGVGQFGYVLTQIGITDAADVAAIVNTMSHKKVYYYETDELVPDTMAIFEKVLKGVKDKYQFVLHAPSVVPADQAPAVTGVDAPLEIVKATAIKPTKRSAKKAPTKGRQA
jgi:hypothetical protein